MEKRYTLPVAIAMVVGTVIGSGIFFKAEAVLKGTGGNLGIGILAFIIMGIVMIISACTFGIVAQSHEGVDGLVGFAKASCGKTYSYYVGWFMAVVYYPSLVGVLCWLPARYFGVLIGWEDPTSGPVMTLAIFFMVVTYLMNALAPKLAGKFQISTTIIKLIPLLLMAVVGTIVGLSNGQINYNFANVVDPSVAPLAGLFGGVVSLSFAFEGWICATSIGSELKDSKRNLPKALLIGGLIIVATYILYYIGVAGGATNQELCDSGATDSATLMANAQSGAKSAFMNVFGQVGGIAIFAFVSISCWGTCNGLMMAVTRGMYDLAADGDYRKFLQSSGPQFVWNALYRRSAIGNLRFDEHCRYGLEDFIFNAGLYARTDKVHYLPQPVYRHFESGQSTSQCQTVQALQGRIGVLDRWMTAPKLPARPSGTTAAPRLSPF